MPPSEYKVGQFYEWCTDIPLRDEYRESPSFFLYGTEWFLRLLLHRKGGYGWCFSVYLELRTEVEHYEPCYIKCEIGFKQEETLSLGKVEFEASEHREVWAIRSEDLQNALPYDYMTGNLMKLVLCFDDVTEPLLVQQRAENTSSQLPSVGSQFRLEKLAQDFTKMLHDGRNHDVEIKCEDHTWKVHKNVLSARSEVLRAMLDSDMVEGRTGVITFQDMDQKTVQQFLNYIYGGELPEMTLEVAKQFYEIGDKYAVECLRDICANYFIEHLNEQNSCETLMMAVQHSDSCFKDRVVEFIIKKKVFLNNELWQYFRQCNPMIALEVYERFCKAEFPG